MTNLVHGNYLKKIINILDIANQKTHDESEYKVRQGEATPTINETLRRSTRQIKEPIW